MSCLLSSLASTAFEVSLSNLAWVIIVWLAGLFLIAGPVGVAKTSLRIGAPTATGSNIGLGSLPFTRQDMSPNSFLIFISNQSICSSKARSCLACCVPLFGAFKNLNSASAGSLL